MHKNLLRCIVGFSLVLTPFVHGQTGIGGTVHVWGNTNLPALSSVMNVPASLTNVIAVDAGSLHALAVKSDGKVVGWGNSTFGQTNVPSGLSDVVAVACGFNHSIALRANGTVAAWGDNTHGIVNVPAAFTNITAIASGAYHAVALTQDGSVRAWGRNTAGQTNVPANLTNVVAIAAGNAHSLAVKADGQIVVWGNQPAAPGNLTDVVAVSGGFTHSVALKEDGTAVAWGSNNNNGQTNVPSGLSNVIAVGAGRDWCVALKSDGTLTTWGKAEFAFGDMPVVSTMATHLDLIVAIVDTNRSAYAPTILLSPQSRTVAAASDVALTVTASGFGKLYYQWFFNETNLIAGATNKTLNLGNIQINQSGSYQVVVTNTGGSVTSSPAILQVLPGLDIAMAPVVSLYGTVGVQYRLDYIEAVGDPNNWISLVTLTLTNNPHFYPDISAIGQPKRFYRIVQE